ncbi:hypothetical protein MHYP_G00269360 [Metynnis hypsauchen]
MKIDKEFFWTDSQVVLAYINNESRRFHVYVANRVQLIRENTDPSQWGYVDMAENPADHASRGLCASDISSSFWISGPKFLWEQEVHATSNPSTELLVGDPEVKSIQVFATKKNDCIDILNRLRRFSSWTMLLKVVARIKRLGSKQENCKDFVAIEDRERAAKVVIKLIQQQAFSSEVNTLKRRGNLPNSSPLYSLDPILDEGLLRVGGRLKHSSLTQELKHPIILPKDDHITRLILSHYHVKTCHQGRCQTLMELRANGFWVIGGSKSVARSMLPLMLILCLVESAGGSPIDNVFWQYANWTAKQYTNDSCYVCHLMPSSVDKHNHNHGPSGPLCYSAGCRTHLSVS